MLDCKHAGPSLPPSLTLLCVAEGSDHTASCGQEAESRPEEAVGRRGIRVPQVWGGERSMGTQ